MELNANAGKHKNILKENNNTINDERVRETNVRIIRLRDGFVKNEDD